MKEPNFFIVGAPKCGTTSLAKWLAEHPMIFMSNPKEPHHFNTDHRHSLCRSEAEYLRLFRTANETHVAVGEASPFYLYSKTATSNILEKCPQARFIVCLRDPADLIVSLHNQNINALFEDQLSLSAAWHAQIARQKGELWPPHCPDAALLQYSAIGRLATQLDALFAICPRDQVQLVYLDDLKRDPQRIYRELLYFLSVPDDSRDTFSAENTAAKLRSRLLRRIIFKAGKLKNALGLTWFSFGLLNWITQKNLDRTARNAQPEPEFVERILRPFFEDEIKRLGDYRQR